MSQTEHSARVLVVDDQPEMIELLEVLLTARGFLVDGAQCVDEARLLLSKAPPDVVITDLEMPGDDGFDLLEIVETSAHRVPVIALTGTADERILGRARASSFRDVLAKPYDSRLLFSAIGRALAQPLPA